MTTNLKAQRIAQGWLRSNRIIIDTETTGMGDVAEIIEIAAINSYGAVLLNTLVKPFASIPAEATAIHGITDEMVANAPTWPEVIGKLLSVAGTDKYIAYNADFDMRMMLQSTNFHFTNKASTFVPFICWKECAMKLYAEYRGMPGERGDYKRHKLTDAAAHEGVTVDGKAHRALADCLMTLGIIKAMARGESHA